jgi:hypothetical protein
MPRARTGKLEISGYFVVCPHCDNSVPNPRDGSTLWDALSEYEKKTVCIECGATVVTPKRLQKGTPKHR